MIDVNLFVFTFPRGEAYIKITVLGQLYRVKSSKNGWEGGGGDQFFFGVIVRTPNLTSQKEKSKSHIIKIISQK